MKCKSASDKLRNLHLTGKVDTSYLFDARLKKSLSVSEEALSI
jgi:hypothetical protein